MARGCTGQYFSLHCPNRRPLTHTTAVIFPPFHISSSTSLFSYNALYFFQVYGTILRTGFIPGGMQGFMDASLESNNPNISQWKIAG